MKVAVTVPFDSTRRWQLSPNVSLRHESFGALAYHHLTRRLVFLKSPQLVDLVRELQTHSSADAALLGASDGTERDKQRRALYAMARTGFIVEC